MTDTQRHQRDAREYLGLHGAADGVAPEMSDERLHELATADEASAMADGVHLIEGSAFEARRDQRDGLREHSERLMEMSVLGH